MESRSHLAGPPILHLSFPRRKKNKRLVPRQEPTCCHPPPLLPRTNPHNITANQLICNSIPFKCLEDCTVRLWDAAEGTSLETFKGLNDPRRSVAFSADGDRLLTNIEVIALRAASSSPS
jgi:WD40 repeat protein